MVTKKNILICEDSLELGKSLALKLKKRKFGAFVIENNIAAIKNRINCFRYDAVVLHMIGERERYYRIIKRFSADFPEMQIIVITYPSEYNKYVRILKEGADRCLVMPMNTELMADFIAVQMACQEYDDLSPEIAGFLIEEGVNDYKKSGFRYLCMALELCLNEPERRKSLMTAVYGEVGKRTETNASCVERTIRYMFSNTDESVIEKIMGSDYNGNVTNGALIDALCKNYRKGMDVLLMKAC